MMLFGLAPCHLGSEDVQSARDQKAAKEKRQQEAPAQEAPLSSRPLPNRTRQMGAGPLGQYRGPSFTSPIPVEYSQREDYPSGGE